MALEVIGAGFGRTGTNSFQLAVEQLGFAPCHHMNVVMHDPGPIEAWRQAAAGTLTDWDQLYRGFRAICDFPHCIFYRELAEFYPDAKVVLTVRDADEWYDSARATIFSPQMVDAFVVGEDSPIPGPLGELMGPLSAIIERVIPIAQVGERDVIIEAFERHNDEVRRTIPADRLLVYDVAEGWEPLCAFLGVPVPDAEFPKVNTTEEFQQRRDGD